MVENRMETRWRLYNASGVRWQRMVVRHADEKPLVSAGNIGVRHVLRLVKASAAFPGPPALRGSSGEVRARNYQNYCLCGTSLRRGDTGSPNNATCADLDHCATKPVRPPLVLGRSLPSPSHQNHSWTGCLSTWDRAVHYFPKRR